MSDSQRVMFILTDISVMQELIKKMKKLRSLYFSQITHELKTPLISIFPLLQKLREYIKEERGRTILKIVQNSATHLQNVINDILDMTRIEHGNFQIFKADFNIRETLEEVTEILTFQASQKNISIITDVKKNVPLILNSDKQRYKQILFNLVGNSIKFTFQGSVTI